MRENLLFHWNRIREKLWVKPLLMSVVSVAVAFLATLADQTDAIRWVPDVSTDSVETLLDLVTSSMLVIAMFAVGAMVTAYGSASNSATPRAFSVVLADDTSQNALSVFIGVFIYGAVALVALKNDLYDHAGRFALFIVSVLVFALVILTFIRWMDNIARLGRMGNTIDKVEAAVANSFASWMYQPRLGGLPAGNQSTPGGVPLVLPKVGYLQRVDMAALQAKAEQLDLQVILAVLPGKFCTPGNPVAHVQGLARDKAECMDLLADAFHLADQRTYDQDPRFGLVVLCEIASRALSPAVNDPGTAIDVIGTSTRLFHQWALARQESSAESLYDRVYVPDLREQDLFDDAFNGLARDGAGLVEVSIRLQKAFQAMAGFGDASIRAACLEHSRRALARNELVMVLPQDIEAVRRAAGF
ncbi:MAG: DUF2254 domain-containing protein [Limnobacter sp.]|uniref:DUF2254 domain-containing protein n=1 Tax=Limnobacter sp. TaxID=2003368 RepID=UPI0032EF7082